MTFVMGSWDDPSWSSTPTRSISSACSQDLLPAARRLIGAQERPAPAENPLGRIQKYWWWDHTPERDDGYLTTARTHLADLPKLKWRHSGDARSFRIVPSETDFESGSRNCACS